MRETMMSLAVERQQTQEPLDAADCVRRMSVCLQDMKRASRDWRADQSALGRCADRRRSVLDVIGNIDEGFTALSWLASSLHSFNSSNDIVLFDKYQRVVNEI